MRGFDFEGNELRWPICYTPAYRPSLYEEGLWQGMVNPALNPSPPA